MKIMLIFAFCVVILCASFTVAQTPSTPAQPYRNIEMWFATQSAPDMLEKAQWALDDINAYRSAVGLPEYPEMIITAKETFQKPVQPRRFLSRFRR